MSLDNIYMSLDNKAIEYIIEIIIRSNNKDGQTILKIL